MSISEVLLSDLDLFLLKSVCISPLISVGAELNQLCKSQLYQSLQMSAVMLKVLAWGGFVPSGSRRYCPEQQIRLFFVCFLLNLSYSFRGSERLCDRC